MLAVGGLEPSGRAGLVADLSSLERAGVRPCAVASALTVQGRAFRSEPVRPDLLRAQLEAVLDAGPLAAVKVGMVPARRSLEVLLQVLPEGVPWVVDPVVRSSRGEPLSALVARDYLSLAAPQVVLTPNVPEAEWLLGLRAGTLKAVDDVEFAAAALATHGFGAVLVKGGHLSGSATDLLFTRGRVRRLVAPRVEGVVGQARGTGCRFASTLAAALGRGARLEDAARLAKREVRRYLESVARPAGRA